MVNYTGAEVWDKGKECGKGSGRGRSGAREGGAGEEQAGITWIIVVLVDPLVLSLTPRRLRKPGGEAGGAVVSPLAWSVGRWRCR